MPFVITELCVRDGACVEVCPVTCIHTTPEAPQFYIDPDVCIECEQCVVVCPVDAVFLDIELPDQYARAEEDNAAFFRVTKEPVEQLSYQVAMEIIHGAEEYAQRMGHKVSVAVVDGTGVPLAVSRMEGAAPHSSQLALNKAYTATLYTIATDSNRLAHRSLVMSSKGRIMAGGGGLPVMGAFGAATIGGVGVAGSINNEADALCCRAGINVVEGGGHAGGDHH